jgi:hypothetical protein
MDMNEVFSGLTLFLVSVLVLTQDTGLTGPVETIVGIIAYFGVLIPPSYLLAGLIMSRSSD